MTYFSELPRIFYDFNINGVNEMRILRDISANIRFKKDALQDITLFDEYDIVDGDTPDIISEKAYGSPQYNWVVMLLNDRFDYLNDFPLDSGQLDEHVTATYGVGKKNDIHHYKNSAGYEISSIDTYIDPYMGKSTITCNLNLGSNLITSVAVDVFAPWRAAGLKFIVTGIGLNSTEQTRVTAFVSDSSFTIDRAAGSTLTGVLEFTALVDPLVGSTSVTNFEHEFELNEAKRRIKLLHHSMLQTVLLQMRTLMNG